LNKTVLTSLVLAGSLLAGENALKTHTELSLVDTSGNTDTTSLAFEFKADKSWSDHALKLNANAYYSEDSGEESKNKFSVELNYNYPSTSIWAFDYQLGYKEDKFSTYESQLYTGPGVKYKAIENDKRTLDLYANVLYASDKLQDADESDDYMAYKIALDYSCLVLENLTFKQEANWRGSFEESDVYFIYSKTALESKISDIFSMGLSYKVDYANLPLAGTERSDRTMMASLIIDY